MNKKKLTTLKAKAKEAVDHANAWGNTPAGKKFHAKLDKEIVGIARKNAEKLARIDGVIHAAEEFCRDQTMPEGQICMAALKDIRRIVRGK